MFVCEQLLIHCAFGIEGSFYCGFSVLEQLCIRMNALNRLGWDEVRVVGRMCWGEAGVRYGGMTTLLSASNSKTEPD